MAVYTQVSNSALAAFLADYELGIPLSFKGIAEGVENSNYFLETDRGKFILTLFEKRVRKEDLPFFIGLKQHLADRDFPCPRPIPGRDSVALRMLEGRPAVIVSFLPGLSLKTPGPEHCHALGAALARLHAEASDFAMTRPNQLGPDSWPDLWSGRAKDAEALQPGLARVIEDDIQTTRQLTQVSQDLPRGIIHADLFPDNAFFLEGGFAGVIDFYFACSDVLAYDLAICLNAWTFGSDGQFDPAKGQALIAGYETVRKLMPQERHLLPALARGAALRFFLTRLIDWSETPADALVKPHDPMDYAKRLAFHRTTRSASDYGA